MAAGEHSEPVDTPIAGVVRDVRPGVGIGVRAEGRVIGGVEALGEPTRGVLALGAEPGEGGGPGVVLRPGSLDVGLAGTILVVGSRVDAEALTRARAMGLRGVVVAGLAGKERRDFLASEARQRASLHRLPPFAVLVLDGAMRRRIASPVAAIFARARRPRGRDRHRSAGPRLRRADGRAPDAAARPRPGPGRRAGRREGRWAGLGGPAPVRRRLVPRGGLGPLRRRRRSPIPLADLERFG